MKQNNWLGICWVAWWCVYFCGDYVLMWLVDGGLLTNNHVRWPAEVFWMLLGGAAVYMTMITRKRKKLGPNMKNHKGNIKKIVSEKEQDEARLIR